MRRVFSSAALAVAVPIAAAAQVLDVRELNTEQIRGLDRAKTAVILTGGILEQHGPYLPSYTDGYWNERVSRDLAEAIAARGWTALVFPPIPLGEGGANMIGGKHSFPGSFNVSGPTLRGVYMDLGDALGEQGFRWAFIVDGHASPLHNRTLDEAGDYFHDTHGGRMVHLYGLQAVRTCCGRRPLERQLSEAERAEDGFTVHAGVSEHSTTLFLRPDLVPPGYRSARSWTGKEFMDLVRLARSDDWPGYFGAPRLATAALGAQLYLEESQHVIATALRVLDGWDPSGEPRYADTMFAATPVAVEVLNPAIKEEERRLARQHDWVAHKARP